MKIAIDASKIAVEQKTGVELVVEALVRHIILTDKHNTYILYTPTALPEVFTSQKNVHMRVVRSQRLWTSIGLAKALAKDKPAVFWQPGNILPLWTPTNTKTVITIHDVGFLAVPEAYSFKSWLASYLAVWQAKWFADKLVAVSQATAKDLRNLMYIANKKISVITNALISSAGKEAIKPNYLPERYFLYIGRVELRKNILRLLEAFAEFKKTDTKQTFLLLIGGSGYGYDRILKKMSELGVHQYVIVTGFLPSDITNTLIKKALAIVYPSLYEGFGLPILQGFEAKVPVITSSTGAMAEVAGNSAYLVNPIDSKSIASGLTKISEDKALRDELINLGKKRLENYSWQKSALEYVELFNNLV